MLDIVGTPGLLAPPSAIREDLADGGVLLRSPEPLGVYSRCIGDWLERWARETPDVTALAERDDYGGWRRLTWQDTRRIVGALGQSLLLLNLPATKPVVILSDNSVDHALMMLAALHVGRPVCSVSSAYCRLTSDYSKIAGILCALDPALVYASDAETFGPAIAACGLNPALVFSRGAFSVTGALSFTDLAACLETADVKRAFDAVRADDIAKYMLTSGSTGQPKVVVNTHRMLCANQQMIGQVWRFLEEEKPILVDWLPWSHTFGGNHNLNMVLRNGGTLYIDDGRPTPDLIGKTVRNLREVKPNLLFNVPRGLDMLAGHLENDSALAHDVFARLLVVFYAAAALPSVTWKRLEAVASQVRTEPLWLTTAWGSTETSPAVTSAHWRLDAAGCIGNPLPGLELKLVPSGPKREIRVRGVTVFPGYLNAPELTAAAFDEEGFYKIGDAGHLVDAERPELGIMFDGRVAEDFKLSTGTWVSVGTLRLKLVTVFAPFAQDVVIAGHDRDEITALIFPSAACAKARAGDVSARIGLALQALRAEGGGSSQTPVRAMFLTEPPNADRGEITDKGYVNQRAVLDRRASEVGMLYRVPSDPRVISAG